MILIYTDFYFTPSTQRYLKERKDTFKCVHESRYLWRKNCSHPCFLFNLCHPCNHPQAFVFCSCRVYPCLSSTARVVTTFDDWKSPLRIGCGKPHPYRFRHWICSLSFSRQRAIVRWFYFYSLYLRLGLMSQSVNVIKSLVRFSSFPCHLDLIYYR